MWFGGGGKGPKFGILPRPLLGICLLGKHLYQKWEEGNGNHLIHAKEWRQRELMDDFTVLGKERWGSTTADWPWITQNGETICRKRLKLPSEIEPTHSRPKDNGLHVVGIGWMPATDRMVCENKGKERKPPRLDLEYKRNSTHEYGNNKNERRSRTKIKEKHMKEIWIVSWKWKKREKRKNGILKRREKVENTRLN